MAATYSNTHQGKKIGFPVVTEKRERFNTITVGIHVWLKLKIENLSSYTLGMSFFSKWTCKTSSPLIIVFSVVWSFAVSRQTRDALNSLGLSCKTPQSGTYTCDDETHVCSYEPKTFLTTYGSYRGSSGVSKVMTKWRNLNMLTLPTGNLNSLQNIHTTMHFFPHLPNMYK